VSAKQTPERGFSIVAQGSQCPERALVNPGYVKKRYMHPRSGVLQVQILKHPASGVRFYSKLVPGLTCPSGIIEPWATIEKLPSGVCFALVYPFRDKPERRSEWLLIVLMIVSGLDQTSKCVLARVTAV